MFNASSIKGIQDVMRKDVGVDGDAQRLGQLVWMIFLKVFDDREAEWELLDEGYTSPIPAQLRWRSWASDPEGLTGDEFLRFVNDDLFPGLKTLESMDDRARVVRAVFEDAYNYMKSGTLLRQVTNRIAADLDFNRSEDRHLFGDLYEQLLKGLQSAGDAGEYYTPRAITRFAVEMSRPRLGERVLDPACGTGGFLTSALEYIRAHDVRTADDEQRLHDSIMGFEKKPLPHLLCTTNMILHGVDVPVKVKHDNTLARPLRDYGPRDRVQVIVTNPPFRGMEEDGIENNFPTSIRTRETADLFLALVIHLLEDGGRAAIVLPDSSLFGDGTKHVLRKKLLDECRLHTIVRLPHGVFSPYTDIRTNILFFEKGGRTNDLWFYEVPCPVGKKYTKKKPIMHADLDDVRDWWDKREETDDAWIVSREAIDARDGNLDIGNPRREDIVAAFTRSVKTYRTATQDIVAQRERIAQAVEAAAHPIGERARSLLETVTELASHVALSSGVVEDLRTAMTELALSGDLSTSADGDESIAETLSRYKGSERLQRGVELQPLAPFDIPQHWAWVRLGTLTEFDIGRTPSTKDSRLWATGDEGFAWTSIKDMPRRGVVEATERRISNVAHDNVFKRDPIPAGNLLMAFKLSVGKTAILGIDAYHNEAIASLHVEDAFLKRYLLWALPALASHAAANPAIKGITLNSGSIARLWVPVPPRQEQERLVEALESTTALIEEVAEVSEELRDSADEAVKHLAHGRAMSQKLVVSVAATEGLTTPADALAGV